jgi:hypothetical protein
MRKTLTVLAPVLFIKITQFASFVDPHWLQYRPGSDQDPKHYLLVYRTSPPLTCLPRVWALSTRSVSDSSPPATRPLEILLLLLVTQAVPGFLDFSSWYGKKSINQNKILLPQLPVWDHLFCRISVQNCVTFFVGKADKVTVSSRNESGPSIFKPKIGSGKKNQKIFVDYNSIFSSVAEPEPRNRNRN